MSMILLYVLMMVYFINDVFTLTSMNLNKCRYELNIPSGWCFSCEIKDGIPPTTNPC